jgi:Transcriptional regulators
MKNPPIIIKQKTVAEQLVREIRRLIANGSYKSNDQLPTELELAKQFNVSRGSVREAIKTLNYLGIVESHTSRGTRITNKTRIIEEAAAWSVLLGYEDMRDVFTLGTALDTQVSIIAVESLKHNPLAYVDFSENILSVLHALLDSSVHPNADAFKKNFSEFFRTFYSITNNNMFVTLNECIDSLITEKVCNAYFEKGVMLEVAEFFASAWQAVQHHSKMQCISLFQDYGAFAYDIYTQYEEQINE